MVARSDTALSRVVTMRLSEWGTMADAGLAQLGEALGQMGCADEARAVLARLTELSATRYVSPYHLAYVHTGLGEHDMAIGWLGRAFAERAGAVYRIKGSFLFEPLRGQPRFVTLLGKLGLA